MWQLIKESLVEEIKETVTHPMFWILLPIAIYLIGFGLT